MVRVGDAIHLRRSQVKVDRGGQYGEIGVRSFGRGIFHKEPISGAKLGNKRVFWIEPGDLVLSNVFAWEGAIAVAGDGERGKIGSHRFMTYVADPEVAQVEYLCHYFLSDHGLPLIQNASPGGAGRNRTLGIDAFENLEIPLPSAFEQRRISEILGIADDAVKSAECLIDKLNRQHEGLLRALVEKGHAFATVGEIVSEPPRRLIQARNFCRDIGVLK